MRLTGLRIAQGDLHVNKTDRLAKRDRFAGSIRCTLAHNVDKVVHQKPKKDAHSALGHVVSDRWITLDSMLQGVARGRGKPDAVGSGQRLDQV